MQVCIYLKLYVHCGYILCLRTCTCVWCVYLNFKSGSVLYSICSKKLMPLMYSSVSIDNTEHRCYRFSNVDSSTPMNI